MRWISFSFSLPLAALLFLGCARAPIKSPEQAMRPTAPPLSLNDDLNFVGLAAALRADAARLLAFNTPVEYLRFGELEVTKQDYRAGLEKLAQSLEADPTGAEFLRLIQSEYEFHEVYGGDSGWGSVFITSYYEPVIKGRFRKQAPYTQPIYGRPRDLVAVDMGRFSDIFTALKPFHESVIVQKSRDGFLRGRLLSAAEDPIRKGGRVVPYFSRDEIDRGALEGRAPILCYVDPVDAFFLQIQGSGRVDLQDLGIPTVGEGRQIRLGYADQNGHPYVAIGKHLLDIIPKEKMSAQRIDAHLRSLPATEAQKIMALNSSFVFFQKQDAAAVTLFGTEAVVGRTIATDTLYFPKGALGFLEYEAPVFKDATSNEVAEFVKSSRFILDQDTGGAIRGPGRVDLFWGSGPEAARVSGVMRNSGRLYYILPKKRAL